MEKELKKRMIGSQELFFGIFLSAFFVWMTGLLGNCLIPCFINGLFICFAIVITIVAYKKRSMPCLFCFHFVQGDFLWQPYFR